MDTRFSGRRVDGGGGGTGTYTVELMTAPTFPVPPVAAGTCCAHFALAADASVGNELTVDGAGELDAAGEGEGTGDDGCHVHCPSSSYAPATRCCPGFWGQSALRWSRDPH